jgi:Domain of unknown function (DUF4326)
VSDNYPVLVASASLPSIREQAEQLRCYLADDANEFDKAWLEEQQRRLQAVYSYVKDRQLRTEVSRCQRLIEIRIGEWLGPTQQGDRTDLTSLPGNEVKINNRHKHEFRLLAENKDVCLAILEKYEGKAITRAALLSEIRAARDHAPEEWSEDELARRERVEAGLTVVANLRGTADQCLLDWAKANSLLVRIDRRWNWDDPSKRPDDRDRPLNWGNPFEMPADGDRDTVCDHYILHHLPYKPSLLSEIHTLKGKVLACWCYPERCHGDYLAELANKTGPEQKPLHLATRAIGLADNFSKFVETVQPQDVWQGLKDYEKSAFFANLRVIGDWIDSVEQIKETMPMA